MVNTKPTEPSTLSISCVVYDTDYDILATTIESLNIALEIAKQYGSLKDYKFSLINNQSFIPDFFKHAVELAKLKLKDVEIISGHGNIGYGRANNLTIHKTDSNFHLILNPDVKLDSLAIHEGLNFLKNNEDVGLVAPNALNENGVPEYLCKRMPSPLVIFLRGINNKLLNRIFKRSLDWYTYKDKLPADKPLSIELASGCFMLCRTETLKKIGGFSPEYFLYFEDFDLSRRIAKKVFLPSMQITHLGGKAATKGWKHIKLFLRSYFIFLKG
ncbi:glycosyl transferase [Cellvibrio zantedeschiae]|uniref:Glycosyl transferase n=1 Tax=Cellvibrio zantedeschiae TaxID=1237077 RepID=A0ABQ3B3Q5_9GAMM|nr:glycosyltransferase family 2 protein [Cellvibrio zantedeschiae]GGY72729.1 glycosyl transferase [Cellvibrio zantedeschiae]